MTQLAEERTSRSLLYPGQDIEPGEGYCLACPDHWGPGDPAAPSKAYGHFKAKHHPTASRALRAANPG